MSFGQVLKELRKRKKMTQQELGDVIHVSKVSISGYENSNRFPDTETLEKIADFFEVSVDYLLGRDVPDWATNEDVLDLQDMLNSNVNMAYGGEHLTEEEKQRVKDVLTGIFWEKLQEKKTK